MQYTIIIFHQNIIGVDGKGITLVKDIKWFEKSNMGSSSSTTMHCINYLDHELETSRELERAKVSLKQLEVYRTAYEISRGWRKPNQFTYSHPNDEELGDVYLLIW